MAGQSQDRRKQVADSVSILLWNVNFGSSSEVATGELLDSMHDVLNEIKEKHFVQLMVLCTDQVTGSKSKVLEKYLCGRDRGNNNEHAEVFHTEDLSVDYLKSDKVQRPYGKRSSVTILTKGEKKILVASWHGPAKGEKAHDCLSVFKQLQELGLKNACRAVIVGGDFNMEPEKVRAILDTNLQYLYAEVGDQYLAPEDRRKTIDFLVYWPKWAFIITGTEVVANKQRTRLGKMVFDHPIVKYTMWDWSRLDLDRRFVTDPVTLRKWELVKANAEFTFSFPGQGTERREIEHDAEQIQKKLNIDLYRVKGSAVLQDSISSSTTIMPFGQTQLFLSKHYSAPKDIVHFDEKVRRFAAEKASSTVCGTVYGVFRMEGSVRISDTVTKNPGPRRKKAKRNPDVTSTTDQNNPHTASMETVAHEPSTGLQMRMQQQKQSTISASTARSVMQTHSSGICHRHTSSARGTKPAASLVHASPSQRVMPPPTTAAAKRKALPGDGNPLRKFMPSAVKGRMKIAATDMAHRGLWDSAASSLPHQPTSGAQVISSLPDPPHKASGTPMDAGPTATPSTTGGKNAECNAEFQERGGDVHLCPTCGKTCKTKSALTDHRRQSHGFYTKRLYKCRICGKAYKDRDSCLAHEISHTRVWGSPQQEDTLNASGTSSAAPLKQTLPLQRKTEDSGPRGHPVPKNPTSQARGKAHSGRQNPAASSASCTTEEGETTASTTSGGREIHRCSACGKTYKNNNALTKHMWHHHGLGEGRPLFLCHVCNKRYMNQGSYLKHLSSHPSSKR